MAPCDGLTVNIRSGHVGGPHILPDRYDIRREIASGGMGTVLLVFDRVLQRELAVKVLHSDRQQSPAAIRRFVEEALLAGRLQHPGVVPVHDLGHPEGTVPYFSMKLVEGQTLAALLAARDNPRDGLMRFLKMFEQIAQTIAYAHSRHIIHRDLKPLNIMVGRFGEVQVMDWGLAKVLDSKPPEVATESTVFNDSSDSGTGQTAAGLILGTPGFMAPEQARGESYLVDERADVFGLGAILCTILTGTPPIVCGTMTEVVAWGQTGQLPAAFARLDQCGAGLEMIELAKRCLAATPDLRPRNGTEVADSVTGYLAGVEERLRNAELERAAADARAAEARAKVVAERRVRRLSFVLGCVGILTLLGVTIASLWWQQQRADRDAEQAHLRAAKEREMALALSEARVLLEQTAQLADDGGRERTLLASVRRVLGQASRLADDQGLPDELLQDLALLTKQEAVASAERHLLDQLERTRLGGATLALGLQLDRSATADGYAEAFREFGLPLLELPVEEAALRLNGFRHRDLVLACVVDWSETTRHARDKERLLRVARTADQPITGLAGDLRRACYDADARRLAPLVRETDITRIPAVFLIQAGLLLRSRGFQDEGLVLLERAAQRYPGDFWLHVQLGKVYEQMGKSRVADAIRCYSVALSIRPRDSAVWLNLGGSYYRAGNLDLAETTFRRTIEIAPRLALAHANLAVVLLGKNQPTDALTAALEATRLQPDLVLGHLVAGNLFRQQSRFSDAQESFSRAIQAKTGLPGQRVEAIRLLASLHESNKHPERAKSTYLAGLQQMPNNPALHSSYAALLERLNLGLEAETQFRQALQADPTFHLALTGLANRQRVQGKTKDATDLYQRDIRHHPDRYESYQGMGLLLLKDNQPEAIRYFGLALARQPTAEVSLRQLLSLHSQRREWVDAMGAARKLAQLTGNATDWFNLAAVELNQSRLDAADKALSEALQRDPNVIRYRLLEGEIRRRQGRTHEAAVAFGRVAELDPNNASPLIDQGILLRDLHDLTGAERSFAEALKRNPQSQQAQYLHGYLLFLQGRLQDAIPSLTKAVALRQNNKPNYPADVLLEEIKRQVKIGDRLQEVTAGNGKARTTEEAMNLAGYCRRFDKRPLLALQFYKQAFASDAKLLDNMRDAHRFDAACVAVRAGLGQHDAAKLSAEVKSRLRREGLNWLQADLAWFNRAGEKEKDTTLERMRYWQREASLKGVRDPQAMEKLPEQERAEWETLWREVAGLLKRLGGA